MQHTADSVDLQISDIPASIMSNYQNVTLGGGIMFVNKIPYFMTISRNIKFGTAEVLQNQQSATILKAIKKVKSIYMQRGFKVSIMLMDGEFEPLRGHLADMHISLNTVLREEHVS